MKQTQEAAYCRFDAAAPGPYGQYLLPHIVTRAKWNPERYAALGVVWKGYAAGAAAVSWNPDRADEAVLENLFVDPQARGRGIGTALVRLAAEEGVKLGADTLSFSYVLGGGELEAMDRIVRSLGGEPSFYSNVYTLDSAKFHDSPVFGWTLTAAFRPAANVKPFRDLSRDQIDRLNENPAIPEFLRPAARADLMDPALSLAWVENGEAVSFLLTSHSGPNSYAALSGWRADSAPGDAYVHLLTACANLCYYDAGGDFLYHLAPITDHSEELVHAYAGELCTRMEEHQARLRLPIKEENSEASGEGE
ncbi:MAG: GNAT family N-acetyltransferase [Oscillibacter sp.]|nr:GNAT family N-acetyltransferase [Oscillibacter sp.]